MNKEQQELHSKLLLIGKNEKVIDKVAHILDRHEVSTIIYTLQYFGANNNFLKQCQFDLLVAKYRIFDWLAMCIYGRMRGYNETECELNVHEKVITHFCKIYIENNGDSKKFVKYLMEKDLELEIQF